MSKRAIISIIVALVSIGIISIPSYFYFIVPASIQKQTNQNQNVIVTTNDVNVETTDTSETETIDTASTEVTNTNSDITTASGGTPNNAESNSDISTNVTIDDAIEGSSIDTPTELFTDRSTVVNTPDKDHDSLTDTEEALYQTTVYLPDSDKDGYVDGSEIKNGYSPIASDKTLLASDLVLNYQNEEFGWKINYPTSWVAESNRFTSDPIASEFVEVSVKKNSAQQSASEWIAHLYKNVDPQNWSTVEIGGLKGIVSPDGFHYYLANDDVLVNISYHFGDNEQISFRTTFAMMINSFELTN